MRTERKKHHKNTAPAAHHLNGATPVDSTEIEVDAFKAPSPTKAEVKAQEERARKKTARNLEIKKAKEKKKAVEAKNLIEAKKELSKTKNKSS